MSKSNPAKELETRPRRSRKAASWPASIQFGVPLMALALVSMLLLSGSRAAFSDTTSNDANNWAAGTVEITDDDAGAAMFNTSGMKPGDTVTNCVVATYSGSLVPATVSLYGTTGGTGLAPYLDVDLDIGSGGSFGDCTGFTKDASGDIFTGTLSSFSGTHTNFANGLQSWDPAANPESKTYRFSLTLQDDNGAQGLDASATFTWEAQNQ